MAQVKQIRNLLKPRKLGEKIQNNESILKILHQSRVSSTNDLNHKLTQTSSISISLNMFNPAAFLRPSQVRSLRPYSLVRFLIFCLFICFGV